MSHPAEWNADVVYASDNYAEIQRKRNKVVEEGLGQHERLVVYVKVPDHQVGELYVPEDQAPGRIRADQERSTLNRTEIFREDNPTAKTDLSNRIVYVPVEVPEKYRALEPDTIYLSTEQMLVMARRVVNLLPEDWTVITRSSTVAPWDVRYDIYAEDKVLELRFYIAPRFDLLDDLLSEIESKIKRSATFLSGQGSRGRGRMARPK